MRTSWCVHRSLGLWSLMCKCSTRLRRQATLGWDYPEDYSIENNKEDLQEYSESAVRMHMYVRAIQRGDQ